MKITLSLLFLLLVVGAPGSRSHAATIAPKDDQEAQRQFDEAKKLREAFKSANSAAEQKFMLEKAAQENALLAIRNTAPARPASAEAAVPENRFYADQSGNLAFIGAVGAVLLAAAGFFFTMTRRATAARVTELPPAPISAAPQPISKSIRPPPAQVNPAERDEFMKKMDALISNAKIRQE